MRSELVRVVVAEEFGHDKHVLAELKRVDGTHFFRHRTHNKYRMLDDTTYANTQDADAIEHILCLHCRAEALRLSRTVA